jgi:hypothetical protein
VHVTVSLDERLGLTQRERRMVRVRFHEPVDDDLRGVLTQGRHRQTPGMRAFDDAGSEEI